MNMSRHRIHPVSATTTLLLCALLAAAPLQASQHEAQSYPQRPIRLIDPYAPGGGSGVVARLVAAKLSDAWGRQVVVDNRPGASGAIGTELAMRAIPDGHTLVMGTSGSIAISPNMNRLPYDPVRDFIAVTQTSGQAMLVVLHPSLTVTTVKELIVLAQGQPGKLTYASSGSGGSGHLAAELFQSITKVRMIHVPYKGSGPAVQAVVGGETQISFNNILAVLPHVNGGRLRAIAVTSPKRAPAVPNLPTLAESGVTGYEAMSWNGIFAPAKTPRVIIAKLNAEVVKALNSPDVRDKLVAMGSDPVGSTPEQFAAYVRSEVARWGQVIRENNIRGE
ncbi:MAG: Bug family tripartite tricarboxylate transporter substrate binding protein [Betaproteobacteria bacterium]|jgi:tripartite-type tricarboxylate transporter receptor subunit TctC|nr:tripartite tricarboxylate transporter substrate binding protein [Betaproteobacteria bacterium]